MRTLPTAFGTDISQSVVPLVQLVKLALPGGTTLLNTSNRTITYSGNDYLGAQGLGTVSEIDDSPGEVKGLSFTLSGIASSSIALAMDETDQWQGAPIEIYTGVLDANYQVADAMLEWSGTGDTLSIEETADGAVIHATAESSAVDLLRGSVSTISDADQQVLYPGDLAFQYIVDQVDKPVIWPAKAWFYQ